MTQAFILSQLANNLNTSGQLDATDGLVNAVPVANGGTGASTEAAARTNLNVPTRTGNDASGTWGINISGNAATATNATNATNATTAANGGVTSVNGSTGAVTVSTTPTTAQVQTAIAGSNFGDLGTTVIALNATTSSVSSGGTIAGSNLRYRTVATTSVFGNISYSDGSSNPSFPTTGFSALSGTWRNMASNVSGRVVAGSGSGEDPYFATWYPSMWLRIS